MIRSIPPVTMMDIARSSSSPSRLQVQAGGDRNLAIRRSRLSPEPAFGRGFFKKPRNWRFQTKPLFKKIRGPLVDVFHEAEEVLIVIDLGGFRRGDVTLTMTPDKYSIFAKRGDQVFQEEITLPPEVDIENCAEYFRNGVLEIVLPRKTGSPQKVQPAGT